MNEFIEAFSANQLLTLALDSLQQNIQADPYQSSIDPLILTLSRLPSEISNLISSEQASDRNLAHRMLAAKMALVQKKLLSGIGSVV